jgi:hypothetical protein
LRGGTGTCRNESHYELKDIDGACAWVPGDLRVSDTIVASLFVMSLPDGVAVRFTEYRGVAAGVRSWMRRWIQNRREKYQRDKPGELAVRAALFSLVVEQARSGGEYDLVEARVSSYPAVPEDWPELAHAELLARATAFFDSMGHSSE